LVAGLTRRTPAALVRRAERLALRMRKTRDELLSEAVAEHPARHDPRAVTNALNRLTKKLDTKLDAPAAAASRRVIERSKW
jgi:hypothetical protein